MGHKYLHKHTMHTFTFGYTYVHRYATHRRTDKKKKRERKKKVKTAVALESNLNDQQMVILSFLSGNTYIESLYLGMYLPKDEI